MPYFNELPNFQYISLFDNINSNDDFINSKNIFLRAKVNSNILNSVSAAKDYYIKDGERPDTIAENAYGDPELDWVILTLNNITNINGQWPLDNVSFNKYLLDKYETEENIYATHHYETIEIKDNYNRVVLEGGLQVDEGFSRSFKTEDNKNTYQLTDYQESNLPTTVKLNLNQYIEFIGRDYTSILKITDINITSSNFNITGRNQTYTLQVTNTLLPWPSSWGGYIPIKLRSGDDFNLQVNDELGDTFITLPEYLYEIQRVEINNEIITNFILTPQI